MKHNHQATHLMETSNNYLIYFWLEYGRGDLTLKTQTPTRYAADTGL